MYIVCVCVCACLCTCMCGCKCDQITVLAISVYCVIIKTLLKYVKHYIKIFTNSAANLSDY